MNYYKLLSINDKALKLGWYRINPFRDFCYEVAVEMGELGNNDPSDEAIVYAKNKLDKFKNSTECIAYNLIRKD